MELASQKAKRNVSEAFQDRLAQLLADLEAANDRLAVVGRERDRARESSTWLHKQLGQKTRRLELERQFLPLVHLARGPLGQPTASAAKTDTAGLAASASAPALGPREKLRMTQSRMQLRI